MRQESQPVRVLLVEDNPGDARLIQEMLQEAPGVDFGLERADCLSAALERLDHGAFDVILLDLGLPDSQGLDTFLEVRLLAPRVPAVVLTGLDDEAVAARAAHEGAQDYLVKGQIDRGHLSRAIRYAIKRKQIETALREAEERLRAVVSSAPIVLFAADRDGKLTVCQGQGLAPLGLKPSVLEGKPVEQLPRGALELGESLRRALLGEPFTTVQEVDRAVYQLVSLPERSETGEPVGVIGVATDITDRKRAEDELRRSVADLQRKTDELESFSYSVSHDLKEPLRTLEAFSQFLLEDYADRLDEQGRDYLERIGRGSARLKQMIDELLMLSHISRQPEEPARVDMPELLAELVMAAGAMIEEKHAAVHVADALPSVAGDLPHLEQIFGNLIGNALKFNRSERPLVEIGVAGVTDDQEAAFFVRDNGIGIDSEYHERIFGVFQRLHRREEYEGTGAGLAIVKRAAEALGGRVRVESQPDAGTTFYVTLPVWRESPAGARQAA